MPRVPAPTAERSEEGAGERLAAVERALTRVMRQATQPRLYRRLAAAGGMEVDRAGYATLARLEESGPVRLTDLADLTGVDISTVSRQVRSLERQSLVERQCDPLDQRAFRIGLSPGGRGVLERARTARRQAVGRLLESWSDEEQDMLAVLLDRLADEIASTGTDDTEEPA